MRMQKADHKVPQQLDYPTTYQEVKIGKTLYRVTSIYKGEINLKDALEDLAIRRVAREAMSGSDQCAAIL